MAKKTIEGQPIKYPDGPIPYRKIRAFETHRTELWEKFVNTKMTVEQWWNAAIEQISRAGGVCYSAQELLAVNQENMPMQEMFAKVQQAVKTAGEAMGMPTTFETIIVIPALNKMGQEDDWINVDNFADKALFFNTPKLKFIEYHQKIAELMAQAPTV